MADQLPSSLDQSLYNTKVEYRQLGKSGLKVSVPILGCMSIGDPQAQDWAVPEEDALPLLKYAYDSGVNTWDTANIYSQGASEALIGKALRHYAIPRHKVVILTKCFWAVGETPDVHHWDVSEILEQAKDYVNQSGLSRAAIFNAVEASLKRLGTEYIDLFQVHRFDYETPIEETMKALHDLVLSGKVRYIGARSMWAVQFAQMQFVAEKNGWTKFISMQNHYNLLYREEEREMNRFCAVSGVGLIPWAPLKHGRLAHRLSSSSLSSRGMPEASESELTIVDRMHEIAEHHGWMMRQVALVWLIARVTSPVVDVSNAAGLDEVMAIGGEMLTEAEERYLEEPYMPMEVFGHD
ncbi:aldo/keto reductase [Xylaria castorea]|nr:aldo/keto reductase [Xylaria castorea]